MAVSRRAENNEQPETEQLFQNFILSEDHPCIMAKSATQFDRVNINEYQQLGSLESAKKIYQDLMVYIKTHDFDANQFESFLAVFPEEGKMTEKEFETKLWRQLSLLHHVDHQPWDNAVSKDLSHPNFSFSLGGKAFYIIGLHPNSSRAARRFRYPSLVFNFHHQFEKLREMGTFKKVRDTIRKRDYEKNGSMNPMVKDFGTESEARQYSGRAVDDNWECPFKHNLSKK